MDLQDLLTSCAGSPEHEGHTRQLTISLSIQLEDAGARRRNDAFKLHVHLALKYADVGQNPWEPYLRGSCRYIPKIVSSSLRHLEYQLGTHRLFYQIITYSAIAAPTPTCSESELLC